MIDEHGANSYATGGGGSDFENQVGASYLAAVLLGTLPRGLEAGRADEVRFQRLFQGEPLDDLVVFTELPAARAKLSLQIKRDITFGAQDPTFNAIVAACWATFTARAFDPRLDRFGVVCGLYSKNVDEHYQTVLDYARASASAQDFLARVTSGRQSKHQPNFLRLMRGRLDVAAHRAVSDDELWSFLRAMVILYFDVQQVGSRDRANAITNLAILLPGGEQGRARQLLDGLVRIAAQGNRTAGSFDRAGLISLLQSAGFRLSVGRGAAPTADSGMGANGGDSNTHLGQDRARGARRSSQPLAQTLAVMRDRFFVLFEKHRVPITVIPTILRDFGVKPSILEDEGALTDLLTEELVAFLSTTFYVGVYAQTPENSATPWWVRWVASSDRSMLHPTPDSNPWGSPLLVVHRRAGQVRQKRAQQVAARTVERAFAWRTGPFRFSISGISRSGAWIPPDCPVDGGRSFRLSAEIGKGCEGASTLQRACDRDQARFGVTEFSGVWAYTPYVDRAWLRGSSSCVTPLPSLWYKAPHIFCRSVAEACRTNPSVHVHFIRNSKPKSRLRSMLGDSSPDVGIIVEREHYPAVGVTFSTYERWYEQEWDYWKCQLFYKALILFCDLAQAPPQLLYGGKELTRAAFVGVASGTLLPVDALSSGVCSRWHPDDYVRGSCDMGQHNADLPRVKELFAAYHLGSYVETLQRDR